MQYCKYGIIAGTAGVWKFDSPLVNPFTAQLLLLVLKDCTRKLRFLNFRCVSLADFALRKLLRHRHSDKTTTAPCGESCTIVCFCVISFSSVALCSNCLLLKLVLWSLGFAIYLACSRVKRLLQVTLNPGRPRSFLFINMDLQHTHYSNTSHKQACKPDIKASYACCPARCCCSAPSCICKNNGMDTFPQ